jgi:hypothetical protein
LLGFLLVWHTNARDYPVLIGGKPLFSPWGAVPVAFELTVLLAALGALCGLLVSSRLPCWHHPLLKQGRIARATRDGFFIAVECADPSFSEPILRPLLTSAGARRVELIEE